MMQQPSPSLVDGGVIIVSDSSPEHDGLDLHDLWNSKHLDFVQHPATRNKLFSLIF